MKTFYIGIGLSLLIIIFQGCAKDPGPGGTSTIAGSVIQTDYDAAGNELATYPIPEQRVYLVYGGDEVYSEDMRTDPEGQFHFRYLRKGEYTVFVYSECLLCDSGVEAMEKEVTISSAREDVVVEEFTIANY